MSMQPRRTSPTPTSPPMHTEVHETAKINLLEPLMLTAFSGPGLVGTIALNNVIEELKLTEVAYIHSHHIPPATVFIDGILHHPFRIYGGLAGRIVAATCQLPIHDHGLYPVASTLLEWAQSKSVREIVVLDGIPSDTLPEKRDVVFATESEESKKLQAKGLAPIHRGIIGGMAGAILNECLVRGMVGIALFTLAPTYIPDPGGAEALIKVLNELYGLNVDTKKLLAEETELKRKLQELSEAYRKQQIEQGQGISPGPTYV
jgi:uncharacterized protein